MDILKKVLTIAGSDSSGGAGIQADIKTMSALGVYGMSVITGVTAQNTLGVHSLQEIDSELVKKQIEVIFEDIEVDSVKIGMLVSGRIAQVVKENLLKYRAKNIVIDPVISSTSEFRLFNTGAMDKLKELIGVCDLVTPNIPEAEILTGMKIKTDEDIVKVAKKIKEYGVKNVLIKGGHREDNTCTDILLLESGEVVKFLGEKIDTIHTHGTGCTLSSAIASYLAKGYPMEKSVKLAKEYITLAIKNSLPIGQGVGSLGHLVELYKKSSTFPIS